MRQTWHGAVMHIDKMPVWAESEQPEDKRGKAN